MTVQALRSPWVGRVCLAVVLLTTAVLVAARSGFVPFWDGRFYADCIVDAALRRLEPAALRCAGHPTQAYTLYAGAIQMLAPESMAPLLFSSFLLYLLSCAGVYRLARLAFPGAEHATERALLTAAFAAQPAMLAAIVQPNVDLPLVPSFLWAAVFMIRRRWLPVIIMGTLLVFTKETGVLLYLTLIGAYAVAMMLPRPSSPRSPTRTVLRLWPLVLPLVFFAMHVAYRRLVVNEAAIWNAGSKKVVVFQFLFPRIDQYFVNYAALMFVLSFAWITTAMILADGGVAVIRKLRGEPPRRLPGAKRRLVRFLVVLGLATMYVLSRYSSWGNVRYLLPVFALTPLMGYAALVRFGVPAGWRRGMLGTLAALLLLSTVRSADPVTRALYGTFAVGDREMFRMTGVSQECCGAGRDQLVYNLQFTALGDLTSDATAALVTDDSTVVFLPQLTRWETVGPLDSTTHRRTLRRQHIITPRVFQPDTLRFLAAPPSDAVFIALPNGDPDAALRALSDRYGIGPAKRMQRGGYWLNAHRLTLRDGQGQ